MLIESYIIYYGYYASIGFAVGFLTGIYKSIKTNKKVLICKKEINNEILKSLAISIGLGIIIAFYPFILTYNGIVSILGLNCEKIDIKYN